MATQIQSTLDYKLFHRIKSNREINPTHLKRLKKSIQARNFLYLFPIIINKDMEIVDGQHRLQAAIDLGLPIFYMIDDKISKADIAIVNSNRKSWGPMDYIQYFASEGREAYSKLLKIYTEFPKVQKIAAASLITDNAGAAYQGGGVASTLVKHGEINCNHYYLALLILKVCTKLSNKCEYAFKRECMLPIKNLCLNTSLSTEQVLKKVGDMEPPPEVDDFVGRLTEIKKAFPAKKDMKPAKKVEPIPPPPRKDPFKGKDVVSGKDFRKMNRF